MKDGVERNKVSQGREKIVKKKIGQRLKEMAQGKMTPDGIADFQRNGSAAKEFNGKDLKEDEENPNPNGKAEMEMSVLESGVYDGTD